YGMIGGIEETSASFEARSASRSYPTDPPVARIHRRTRRRGRARPQRSPSGCGASACSWRRTKTTPCLRLAFLRSFKRFRTWAGPTAATCGWTFVGRAVTAIGYEHLPRSWVGLQPDMIVTNTTVATGALQRGAPITKNQHKMRVFK